MIELAEALMASGWLASNEDVSDSFNDLPLGADVLPWLSEAAQRASAGATQTRPKRQAESLARVISWAKQSGAKFTFGWPECDARPIDHWIGPRLMWWPRGVPDGRKVAWVSSRLGQAIDERPDWFAVLRSAAAKLDPARDVLLTVPSTTVDRFLERAAVLFQLRRLRVHLDEQRTLVDWLTRLRRQLWRSCLTHDSEPPSSKRDDADGELAGSDVFVSPNVGWALLPVPFSKNKDGQECPSYELPLSDRVLIAAADQVFALQIRPSGNLHQLLRARLSDTAWPPASVWLALGEALVSNHVANELQSLGAVGWWLFSADAASVHQRTGTSTEADASCVGHKRLTELPWLDGDYFVHWTRRRVGPWPDQSEADFIDELLLWQDSASHSAFAALSRIVQQRRLIASAAGIRGDAAVVSLSAKPLRVLTKQRTFRAHRGRWDCEAYGLCLRREWLQARGAKPVIYGDDAQWSALPNCDRPFFQLKTTRSRRGAKLIDWSQEAEWRVPQDLDLSEARRDDLWLFVPTEAEARQLAAISPWPVLVVTHGGNALD